MTTSTTPNPDLAERAAERIARVCQKVRSPHLDVLAAIIREEFAASVHAQVETFEAGFRCSHCGMPRVTAKCGKHNKYWTTISGACMACEAEGTAELREALAGVMKQIEDGHLVRDTSNDHRDDWAMLQLPPVTALGKAKAVLARHTPTPKTNL
jgi:hypothetical protein